MEVDIKISECGKLEGGLSVQLIGVKLVTIFSGACNVLGNLAKMPDFQYSAFLLVSALLFAGTGVLSALSFVGGVRSAVIVSLLFLYGAGLQVLAVSDVMEGVHSHFNFVKEKAVLSVLIGGNSSDFFCFRLFAVTLLANSTVFGCVSEVVLSSDSVSLALALVLADQVSRMCLHNPARLSLLGHDFGALCPVQLLADDYGHLCLCHHAPDALLLYDLHELFAFFEVVQGTRSSWELEDVSELEAGLLLEPKVEHVLVCCPGILQEVGIDLHLTLRMNESHRCAVFVEETGFDFDTSRMQGELRSRKDIHDACVLVLADT